MGLDTACIEHPLSLGNSQVDLVSSTQGLVCLKSVDISAAIFKTHPELQQCTSEKSCIILLV